MAEYFLEGKLERADLNEPWVYFIQVF